MPGLSYHDDGGSGIVPEVRLDLQTNQLRPLSISAGFGIRINRRTESLLEHSFEKRYSYLIKYDNKF